MTRIKSLNTKLLAFILAVCILVVSLPVIGATALEDGTVLEITENGAVTTEITVRPNANRTLRVDLSDFDTDECQWQVFSSLLGDWVNINGKTSNVLEVTYAMLQNIQEDGSAKIRCIIKDEDGLVVTSVNTVAVTMGEEVTVETAEEKKPLKASKPLMKTPNLGATPEKAKAYTVTIKYTYDTPNDMNLNGTAAYQSYVITVINEEEFTKSVKVDVDNRPIKGFEAWIPTDSGYVKADKVSKEYKNLDENKVIEVLYRPGIVDYSYKVYFQNTNNDEYTEVPELAGTAKGEALAETDNTAIINSLASKTQGLRVIPSQKLTIAADGSTVVRIYYDRLYYLMFFDLGDGGYGTDAVYGKYDQEVQVSDPTRPGYVFKGWSKSAAATTVDVPDVAGDYIAIKVPIATTVGENMVKATYYYAVWTTTMADYTVIYWLENADDFDYVYGGSTTAKALSNTKISGKDAPTFAGEDASHYTYFDARSDHDVLVEGNGSTILNVYYVRQMNTIEYHWSGKTSPAHTHDKVTAETTNNFTSKYSTNGCYMQDCNITALHTHTEACLGCGLVEHTHTSACCSLEVHAHSDACAGVCTHTSHTKSCYGINEYASTVNLSSREEPLKYFTKLGLENNCIYRFQDNGAFGSVENKYYLYNDGKWYQYVTNPTTSNYLDGNYTNSVNCSNEGLIHLTDTFYKYKSKAKCTHVHTDECYSCGKIAHDHTSGCNGGKCSIGYEHVHTQNCYTCGHLEHVHSANCYRLTCNIAASSSSKSATYAYSQAKYGADLMVAKDWKGNPVWKVDQIWAVESDGSPFYTTPPTIRGNMYLYRKSPSSSSANIYFRELSTGENVKPVFSFPSTGWTWTNEDCIEIPGFTYNSRYRESSTKYYLYYDRNSYNIDFSDGFSNIIHQESVLYDKSFENAAKYVPSDADYPDSLEKGAYQFEGWYIDPSFSPSSKFTTALYNGKMPYHDFVVYAHWVPVTHTVKFYEDASFSTQLTKTLNSSNEWTALAQPDPIDHGDYIPTKNIPLLQVGNVAYKEGLTFAGWFYYDNGEKKAYDPANMPVKKDLNLYPEWTSDVLVGYKVLYKKAIEKDDKIVETDIELAAPTTGEMYAGNSKAFYAKGQPAWYEDFQPEHYFPLVASHNIEMAPDESKNTFTFLYVEKDFVNYTVNYLDASTHEKMTQITPNPKHGTADDVLIYEAAPEIKDYLPDAYGKSLIATYNEADNVLNFYYSPNTTQSYYHVKYMYRNTDGSSYTESRSADYLDDINQKIDSAALIANGEIDGFHFNSTKTGKIPEVVADKNIEITLYFDRNQKNYVVKYLDETGAPIATDGGSTALFGTTVTENAIDIPGYKPVVPSKELKITDDDTDNVIVFTYTTAEVEFSYLRISENASEGYYEIIDPDDTTFAGGMISHSADTINAFTGTPNGSYVEYVGKEAGYDFVGWYVADEEGDLTVHTAEGDIPVRKVNPSVDLVTVVDNKITPIKNASGIFEEATYYACFRNISTDLTLKRTNISDDTEFIYHITGKSKYTDQTVDLYVTLDSTKTAVTVKNVPIGDYTITEQGKWSWRYTANEIKPAVDASNNEFTFNGAITVKKWISDVINKVNIFKNAD